MRRQFIAVLTALVVAGLPFAAQAGEVHDRQGYQRARIDNGIASGQLTHGETNRLDRRESNIAASRNRDLRNNGGTLTNRERANLNRRQNNVSRNIYFDKHNLNRQPGAPQQ